MAHINFRSSLIVTLALTVFAGTAPAQALPASAHVNLYFPQIVDGGTAAQQWQTAINFTNPSYSPATVFLKLYASSGGPLNLDFGGGPAGTLSISIPPGGSRTVKTKLASDQIRSGWGFGAANVPIIATLTFTQLVDGVPKLSVSAPPTVPSLKHHYPANYFLSIAMANTFSNASVSVSMQVLNSDGLIVAQDTLTLPPSGHTAFTLWQRFPGIDANFQGSVLLFPANVAQPDPYIAWAMGSDSSGVISGLPSGRFQAPRSQWDEIWLTFNNLMIQAEPFIGPQPVRLSISALPVVNALASSGSDVMVTLGLAELLADSPSELAFAIAHELGHIYQQRTGRKEFRLDNPESDADMWGVFLSLSAGYDPYAVAGTLSKLAMATDNANLSGQFFEDLTSFNAHKSFSTRIADAFDTLQFACTLPGLPELCLSIKKILHPHLPANAPLMEIPPSTSRLRDKTP